MYVAARRWGISPSEFENMTPRQWMLEAYDQWANSDEGKRFAQIEEWKEDAELSKEEWELKHGIAKN